MYKIGRNAPCPCGSGKKYKKCCLKKEIEEKAREVREKQIEEDAAEKFWEEFGGATYSDKIARFRDYLTKELDGTGVFEMLDTISSEARRREDLDTLAGLIGEIKEKCPVIYAKDAPYYNSILIENMAAVEDFSGLPAALEAFAEKPGGYIDGFFRAIETLMYYSEIDPLIPAMEKAYPNVLESENIIPSGIDEFSTLLGWLLLFRGLKEQDPRLLYEDVSRYWNISQEEFDKMVVALTTGSAGAFEKQEFLKKGSKKMNTDKVLQLTIAFMHTLNKNGMGYSRALMARNALVEYILDRERLEEVEKGRSILVPQRASLDSYLTSLDILFSMPHQVVALMEALPSYLGFLHAHGFIESDEFEGVRASLTPLKDGVVGLFKSRPEGRVVVPAIEREWERENMIDG